MYITCNTSVFVEQRPTPAPKAAKQTEAISKTKTTFVSCPNLNNYNLRLILLPI